MPVKKKSVSAKAPKRSSKSAFNKMQGLSVLQRLVVFMAVFAVFGGLIMLYRSHALSNSTWAGVGQTFNCPLNGYGVPPTIQSGSTGNCVKFLQFSLNQGANAGKPSAGSPLVEDGIFGPKTRLYVVSLQQKTGLAQDGVVGPNTWVKIKDCLNNGTKTWICPKL